MNLVSAQNPSVFYKSHSKDIQNKYYVPLEIRSRSATLRSVTSFAPLNITLYTVSSLCCSSETIRESKPSSPRVPVAFCTFSRLIPKIQQWSTSSNVNNLNSVSPFISTFKREVIFILIFPLTPWLRKKIFEFDSSKNITLYQQ